MTARISDEFTCFNCFFFYLLTQRDVEELDKLRSHSDSSEDKIAFAEKLEDSLKKLHETNPHHKGKEEKPPKVRDRQAWNGNYFLNQISSTQSFRGAARLAYGQNVDEATEAPTTVKQKEIYETLPLPEAVDATTHNGQRRSQKNDVSRFNLFMYQVNTNVFPFKVPLNAGTMLRQLNGKYSAYDMSQYIFWTGDEEGVAKAVQELIDEGLMSRENAIEFLNDIRLGIDYLENTYSSKHGEMKNVGFDWCFHSKHRNYSSFSPQTLPLDLMISTTMSTTESAPEQPLFNYNYNYQKFHSLFKPSHKNKVAALDEDEAPTLSPAAIKALEKLPSLMKLTEKQGYGLKQDASGTATDESGRSRLADFLYGEYSLEEVIYTLAKTMFTQSLTHGSEESQAALQKLTHFLENEGKHGRISPALQKKILGRK